MLVLIKDGKLSTYYKNGLPEGITKDHDFGESVLKDLDVPEKPETAENEFAKLAYNSETDRLVYEVKEKVEPK